MVSGNFLELIKDEVQSQIGEEHYYVSSVRNSNGECLSGICVQKTGGGHAPVFYLEEVYGEYLNGRSIQQIAEEIILFYHVEDYCEEEAEEQELRSSFEWIKDKILFKLIHYHNHKELLHRVPHIRYLDLAIVFYCDVSDEQVCGSLMIEGAHLSKWHVDVEELYSLALRNTPEQYPPVIQVIDNITNESDIQVDELSDEEQMEDFYDKFVFAVDYAEALLNPGRHRSIYMMTNTGKQFGAAVILYPQVLQNLADCLRTNLYLLPSSIYEMVVIPEDNGIGNVKEFINVVRRENNYTLCQEDILAYSVYYFDRSSGEVSVRSTLVTL